MTRIVHVWFDVDNTLYQMPPDAEAAIFDRMYESVQSLTHRGMKRVRAEYNAAYKRIESHSGVFRSLGLPVDEAREAYDSVDPAPFWDEMTD